MPDLPARPDGYAAIVATFGDPLPFVNHKALWEQRVLRNETLQTPLIYAYDPSKATLITRVRAHRTLSKHLAETLQACLDAGVPLARLQYGGAYVWRAKRTAAELSLHTFGIAVDIEPAANPLGKPWIDDGVMLDRRIITTFQNRGWFWGGDFKNTKDPQHFQWGTGY